METFENMPAASVIVIVVILALFAAALVMLFAICAAYRRMVQLASLGDTVRSRMMYVALQDYTEAYKTFGEEVNTPAIITSVINRHMGFALFCERFLNNAVSLFVTLGLFGTFLGLSMSVASLTELISFSNTSEWLGVLDSVGGGLMSALSGMGVAFYTSLVGVACSILLTILRAIFSPESLRAAMETEMELWLDHRAAPLLETDKTSDNSDLVRRMVIGMRSVSDSVDRTMRSAADTMDRTMKSATDALQSTMEDFDKTVDSFNKGTRSFAEVDYNLRGTVERLDLTVRDLNALLQKAERGNERSEP